MATAFTVPNAADAAFADQAKLQSRDLSAILALGHNRYGVLSGCAVTAQGTPNMTVAIAAGTVLIANKPYTVVAQNSSTLGAADPSNPRWDLICATGGSGAIASISVVAGTPAATPAFPDPAGRTVLAAVYVPVGTSSIDSTRIIDKRVQLVQTRGNIFDATDYGAVPDDFYTDAVVPTAPGTKATVATQGILSGTGTGTFTISSGASYPTSSFTMCLDSEAMTGSISGTTVTITARGVNGTTATTHSVGASLYEVITSATAGFTSADVGKDVVFLRTGDASFLDQDTTVRSVLSSTAITVNNRSTRTAGVYSNIRFYISRAGDQAANIQAAIDACTAAGGGWVVCPGVGYAQSTDIVLKNRVYLTGVGMGATRFHMQAGVTAKTNIRNDLTSNNTAQLCGFFHCTVDNNRDRAAALTVTTTVATGASYSPGGSTLDVTSAANLFQGGGVITIGTNKLTYQDITFGGGVSGSDRLNSITGGQEGSTDASASAGNTVTQIKSLTAYFGSNPFNATPTTAEEFDPHFIVDNVRLKYSGGDGIQGWGQSESRWSNIWVESAQEIGFRPSFDSWVYNCTADGVGRMGFLVRGSSCQGAMNKAFFSGGITAADGTGFMFEGYTGREAGCKFWTNCNAQDNKAWGYRIRNCQRIGVAGSADSNSTSSAGTYGALLIEGPGSAGTNGCIVHLMCTDRNSTTNQRNALKIADTGVKNNHIFITHDDGTDSGAVPVQSAIMPGSILGVNNNISINGSTSAVRAFCGDGTDGTVTFDGSTTILGLAPASSTYTLTRDLYVANMKVNSGVTIKTAGWRIFCSGVLENAGTIHNDGAAGSGTTAGAGGAAGYYMAGTTGGAGGANAAGSQATAATTNCSFGGAGAAGSTATNAGGAQRTVSAPTTAMGGTNAARQIIHAIQGALRTAVGVPTWTGFEGGTGGGGGGSTGTTATGGGGGGGGGVVGIYSYLVINSSGAFIRANGGAGANGANGNGTGAGGGGGGGGLVMLFSGYQYNAGTIQAAVGSTGTGGSAGTAGSAGLVVNVTV